MLTVHPHMKHFLHAAGHPSRYHVHSFVLMLAAVKPFACGSLYASAVLPRLRVTFTYNHSLLWLAGTFKIVASKGDYVRCRWMGSPWNGFLYESGVQHRDSGYTI